MATVGDVRLPRTPPRRVIITGGGTAGHVEPALAVANALVAQGVAHDDICFVGAKRGMEAQLVPAAGYEVQLLPGRGIVRRLALANLSALLELCWAAVRGVAIVGRTRPRCVVMVGGYAGLACSLGAVLWRVPLIVVNVDATPGLANRLAARFAVRSAVAEPGSGLPRAEVTGAPVRAAVRAVDRTEAGRATARANLGLGVDRRVLAVVGGSLGAKRLNDAALELALAWSDRRDLLIYHVAGARNFDEVEAELGSRLEADDALGYRLVPFEADLPSLFAAADLVVARAGAMTVAELSVIGAPAVLVPLPGAPGDHQTRNARRLEVAGAAVVIADEDATSAPFAALLEELLVDEQRTAAMGRAAHALGRPDADAAIARLVLAATEPQLPGVALGASR